MSGIYCDDCGEDLAAGHELDCPQVAPKPATVHTGPGLEATVANMADTLRDAVTAIEESTPTTRGHYARYMAIFSQFADDVGQANILALALIKAGGNEQGVRDALRVSF